MRVRFDAHASNTGRHPALDAGSRIAERKRQEKFIRGYCPGFPEQTCPRSDLRSEPGPGNADASEVQPLLKPALGNSMALPYNWSGVPRW